MPALVRMLESEAGRVEVDLKGLGFKEFRVWGLKYPVLFKAQVL